MTTLLPTPYPAIASLDSLEEDFITWREQFWPAVCEHFGVEATGDETRSVLRDGGGSGIENRCRWSFSLSVGDGALLLACHVATAGPLWGVCIYLSL